MWSRRAWLATALAALGVRPADALPERALAFPRDHGAHPDLRTEWWYITGRLEAGARLFGFQITFFRSRVPGTESMQSRFAARQLLFAHAAVTDVQGRKLWHDQRIARAGFEVADAATDDARLRLRDWSLHRADEGWHTRAPSTDFGLDLRCAPTQPVLLQGRAGLSRKGPDAAQASYYYSLPQLATTGTLTLRGERFAVRGRAWMDHEWSEELLHPDAVGWDWIGMNLDDGSALTAFRLRRRDGGTVWDGGSFRSAQGMLYIASRGETEFRPQRRWTSPTSGASYPVEWIVRTPADFRAAGPPQGAKAPSGGSDPHEVGERGGTNFYTVRALVDDQELDSRGSTGAIYWEGLADLIDSNGRRVGGGYLEMTGYAQRLRL